MKSTISSALRFAKSKCFWAGIILLCFACVGFIGAQTNAVSPFGGVGNVQFFDNNGSPLLGGVLYTYQAGTTTQQASYTDSTGSILNPNPVPLSSGGRASIWLLTGNFYKLVLCSQNDGASCAPGDTLFSVDQVPGGASSSGGSSSSPFISGSANPATSGILRLASGDTVCWRNAGGSANLCWSKDANDLLSWSGGSIKFPEVSAPAGVATFDVLWADATAHRWMMSNNGGVAAQVVASGVDINTSDQVTQLHFGSTAEPLSSTAPTTNQFLNWNGTNIVGIGNVPLVIYNTPSASTNATITSTPMATAGASGNMYYWRIDPYVTAAGSGCTGSTSLSQILSWTDSQTGAASSSSYSATISLNGVLGKWYGGGGTSINAKASTTVSYSVTYTGDASCGTQPKYYVVPFLEQTK